MLKRSLKTLNKNKENNPNDIDKFPRKSSKNAKGWPFKGQPLLFDPYLKGVVQ